MTNAVATPGRDATVRGEAIMREGPSEFTVVKRSCAGCRHLDCRMVRSGTFPIYDNHCKHPDVAISGSHARWATGLASAPRHIGPSDETPSWCPVLAEKGGRS